MTRRPVDWRRVVDIRRSRSSQFAPLDPQDRPERATRGVARGPDIRFPVQRAGQTTGMTRRKERELRALGMLEISLEVPRYAPVEQVSEPAARHVLLEWIEHEQLVDGRAHDIAADPRAWVIPLLVLCALAAVLLTGAAIIVM
ncbi:MAG: hypothetical protein QOJ60_662 [Actinomycetota bacterium]|jgi:hypothetical protein|nr:hypothetical protein [Actinomycetota bacterium]